MGSRTKRPAAGTQKRLMERDVKEEKTGDGLKLIQEVQEVQKTAPKFLF